MYFRKPAIWLLLFAGAAAAAACSGRGALAPCPAPAQPVFEMVDPSPGATGVPDNLSNIVFEGFGGNDLTLQGGTQTIPLTLQPVPSATPTPQGALPETMASLSVPLLAGTTYTVKYSSTFSGANCAARSVTAVLGSFTTQ